VEEKQDKNVTILDVARMAGVSPSTVTHTLNGKRPVGEKTRDRVMKAIAALNYIPSSNAQSLRGGKSRIIGCLAMDITETFVNQIVRGVERGLSGSGLSLLFVSRVEFGNDYEAAYAFLKGHSIDGLLLCHHLPLGPALYPAVARNQVPTASVNMEIPGVISVIPDNYQGGFHAAEHLYASGMRHPAMICGPANRLSVQDRLRGFRSRLRDLGLALEERNILFGEYDFDNGYESSQKLMDSCKEIDGIFCANDYIAAGTIARLIEKGIAIPDQVRVLGFDNRDFSAFKPIPISTFEQPLQEMGFMAISLLRNVIDTGGQQSNSSKHVLQSRLIPRASTMKLTRNFSI